MACTLDASTSGGNINISMKSFGKYVKIGNSSGNITFSIPKNQGLDLDLDGRIDVTDFQNFQGSIDEHHVKGKLNGGGIPVSLNSGSGKIYFEQK